MQNRDDASQRLVPLRKMASPDGYSTAYLSQLVQQGKLKAKKVGRNYYTTKEWFDRYLEKHARNDKCDAYAEEKAIEPARIRDIPESRSNYYLVSGRDLKIQQDQISLYKKATILMVVFILLLSANLFYLYFQDDQGQVAGVMEKRSEAEIRENTATSTAALFNSSNIDY